VGGGGLSDSPSDDIGNGENGDATVVTFDNVRGDIGTDDSP